MFRRLLPALLLLAASPASAHIIPGGHESLATGLEHPLAGADHLAAMVAVGLWAAVRGHRALWALPASFVTGMLAGFLFAVAGVAIPLVEPGILASVILLGGLVAVTAKVKTPVASLLVFAMGMCHGHAHGAELGGATTLAFATGMLIATAVLHGAGVAVGATILSRLQGPTGRRLMSALGVLTAGTGLALAFG